MPDRDPVATARFRVDREQHVLPVAGDTTLNDALRDQLDLTATKVGCEMGNCGSCTVLLDGEPVYSCLVLAAECEGAEIETAAGLDDHGTPGAVHCAFIDEDALQCGFCTPGQVVSTESLRRRAEAGEAVGERTIVEALAGNLCRCGAYRNILDAARSVVGGAGA